MFAARLAEIEVREARLRAISLTPTQPERADHSQPATAGGAEVSSEILAHPDVTFETVTLS